MKKYHFISGLPRSGSTLLTSILKQNPRFTAAISDPLQGYVGGIIRETNAAVGMEAAVPMEKRKRIMRGIFDSFYSDGNEVCFNTNRGWAGTTSLLQDLFPGFKMIVCLRDIPWILDSFEQLNNKNPYTIKPLYHHQELGSVYERTHMLMGNIPNFAGYVSGPLHMTQQCMYSNERDQICFVEYGHLTSNPRETMKQIYQFLGEEWYEHDFDNVEDSYDEFDQQAKIEGLHTIRRKVEFKPRRTVLPQDLWNNYTNASFWKFKEFDEMKKQLNWIEPKQQTSSPKQITKPPMNRQL